MAMVTQSRVVSLNFTALKTPSSYHHHNKPCMVSLPPLKASFFGHGVVRLKVTGEQITYSNRLACNCLGGGTPGSSMGIFKSYINAMLSSFEYPEKILDQAIIEMDGDLVKMRQSVAKVSAYVKQLETQHDAADKGFTLWRERAKLALRNGDEDLARDALRKQKTFARLESKIQEAKSKKDVL